MSSYSDFANAASEILQNKGNALARSKEQSGQIWGSTIANLGQVIPQQVQAVMQQVAAKKKTAQIQSIIQQNGGDLEKSLPLIMGVDANIGAQIGEHVAKVNKDMAEFQKIQTENKKAELDFSDRVLQGVHDEDSYSRWAILQTKLGNKVPDHFDPDYIKQAKENLIEQKQVLESARLGYGSSPEGIYSRATGKVTTPATIKPHYEKVGPGDTLIEVGGPDQVQPASGNPQFGTIEPPPTAPGATAAPTSPSATPSATVTPNSGARVIASVPEKVPELTPYQKAELEQQKKNFDLAQQRLALAIRNSNRAAQVKPVSELADAIMAHPELFGQLTPTAKEKVIPELEKRGFTDFAKPPSATLENRLSSAEAVTQTGNDIIKQLRNPKVAAMLGPIMGRASSIQDFLGNPPPEFANLAGLIESYSLANMGVHGMRATSGAEAIKYTLGVGRHTPESIIATIEGLNGFATHLMQNESPKRAARSATPAAPAAKNPFR